MKYILPGTDEASVVAHARAWQSHARAAVRAIGTTDPLPVARQIRPNLLLALAHIPHDEERISLLRDIAEGQCTAAFLAIKVIDTLPHAEIGTQLSLPETHDMLTSLIDVMELILYITEAPGVARPAWYAIPRDAERMQPSVN